MTQDKYPETMSKRAAAAARRASQGERETALARARDAAGEAQLLHPAAWDLWEEADDELFLRVLEWVSERELARFAEARNERGAGWAAVFSGSPEKFRALLGKGLNPALPMCVMAGGVELEPAMYCAWMGDVDKLCAMMDAGMEPPAALSQKDALSLDASDPRTAAHLLARCSTRSWSWGEKPSQAELERAIGWLFKGAGASKRNGKGYDALKYDIREGSPEVIAAALAHGANLTERDAKGLDAFELLSKTLGEPAGEEGRLRAQRLKEALPRMRSAQEAREIKAATSAGIIAPKARPRV